MLRVEDIDFEVEWTSIYDPPTFCERCGREEKWDPTGLDLSHLEDDEDNDDDEGSDL